MKDNYGNRYRFYEIIQAHKNGEDLSQFTPKNKPEEDLIAELTGSSENGGDFNDWTMDSFNNPNTPGIHYGQSLYQKTLKIDFLQFFKHYQNQTEGKDTSDIEALLDTAYYPQESSAGLTISKCFCIMQFRLNNIYADTYKCETGVGYHGNNEDFYIDKNLTINLGNDAYAMNGVPTGIMVGREVLLNIPLIQSGQTYREYLTSLGIIEIKLTDDVFNGRYISAIFLPLSYNNYNQGDSINLNETPIDFIWFE